MKELIEVITAALIAILAFMAGQANADSIMIPLPGDSGWRIIDEKPPTHIKPVESKRVKVWKSKAELREDIYQRKLTIRDNRFIKRQNRIGLYRFVSGKWERYYIPLKPVKPIKKWKWVKVYNGQRLSATRRGFIKRGVR